MRAPLTLHLGVKADPILYRYSYEWLFRLMAEEGVHYLQIGTFFELYDLPDSWFLELRHQADAHGIRIASMFTAHRELGGFYMGHPAWERVARRNYERLIEIGAVVGAASVGSNPGAVLRDRLETKEAGVACYLRHMRELMAYAHDRGLDWLTIEPMSCQAEPPTLPDELVTMAGELMAYHRATPGTAPVGYCYDVSHGYADESGRVCHPHLELLDSALPHVTEIHLKNTDARYSSTFGFTEQDRARGIIDIEELVQALKSGADRLPVDELVGYLEIGGPKLGRDYSDPLLEGQLRESLRYLKAVFPTEETAAVPAHRQDGAVLVDDAAPVVIAPSVMCADLCHLEESVRQLEAVGAGLLHIDIMDAHFTPNMPLGLELIRQLRGRTGMPFDVHLMVENNDLLVELLAPLGVQWVSVHVESAVHLDRTLSRIREHGMKAGAALNPATPPETLRYVLKRLDFVLVMTVNPGYAGQALVPGGIEKIADCRRFLREHGSSIPIAVDGNVSFANIPGMVAAGADVLIAGTSSVYHRDGTLRANVARTREAIRRGLELRRCEEDAGRAALRA